MSPKDIAGMREVIVYDVAFTDGEQEHPLRLSFDSRVMRGQVVFWAVLALAGAAVSLILGTDGSLGAVWTVVYQYARGMAYVCCALAAVCAVAWLVTSRAGLGCPAEQRVFYSPVLSLMRDRDAARALRASGVRDTPPLPAFIDGFHRGQIYVGCFFFTLGLAAAVCLLFLGVLRGWTSDLVDVATCAGVLMVISGIVVAFAVRVLRMHRPCVVDFSTARFVHGDEAVGSLPRLRRALRRCAETD